MKAQEFSRVYIGVGEEVDGGLSLASHESATLGYTAIGVDMGWALLRVSGRPLHDLARAVEICALHGESASNYAGREAIGDAEADFIKAAERLAQLWHDHDTEKGTD